MGVDISTWRARIGSHAMPLVRAKFVAPAITLGGRLQSLKLSLRLAIVFSVLLLVAGDVERQPGPTPNSQPNQDSSKQKNLSQTRLSFGASGNAGDAEKRTTRNMARQGQGDDRLDAILCKLTTLDAINTKVDNIEQKLDLELKLINKRVTRLERENSELHEKLSKLEEQSRRDNLIFWGFPEKEGNQETWQDCEGLVRQFMLDKLDMQDAADDKEIMIERAHRLGRKSNFSGQRNSKPRGVIVKFTRWKHRQTVMERAKTVRDGDIRVSEDFGQRARSAQETGSASQTRTEGRSGDKVLPSIRQTSYW